MSLEKVNNMMDLYKNIKMLRKARKMSQEDLADRAGYTDRSTIARIEKGEIDLSQSKIMTFAEIFGVTPMELMGELKPKNAGIKIPLYSAISCGTGIFVDDNVEEYLYIPDKFLRKGKDYFAVTANGDSMVGKGIKSGDILVFEKTQILDNGEVGSFCIDENDAVCKVFRKLSTGIVLLESANDKYAPIEIDVSQDTCFRIIGRYKFKFSVEQED